MISSDRNSDLQRQQVEIAINQRIATLDRLRERGVLPYDPTNAPDDASTPQIVATQYLDNSDFDFSKDGYINNPTVGGDQAQECYNWYRQRFIKVIDLTTTATSTAVSSADGPFKAGYSYPMDFVLLNGKTTGEALIGTLTRVDDNNATLSVAAENTLAGAVLWFGTTLAENSTNALKASGHSTFAANEGANDIIPRWDKTNGWVEIASDTDDAFDLACPLPLNFVRGGITLYFRCIIALRSGATANQPVRLSIGIWDSTTAEKRFIESANLDLSVSPVGTTGATTYTYKIIADLDDGTTIESDEVTIANGNATLSASNYNRLVWDNAVGVLNFRIYRSVGGIVKRVFTITNGGHDFNDTGGDEGETLGSLPDSGVTRPIAYRVSSEFNPQSETTWQIVRLRLEMPGTYDTSRTTSKQWFRLGIEGTAGSERLVTVDRVMLSTSDGGWQRSSRDLNKILNQNPSSLPTSTTQGGTGIDQCFPLDTPILICDKDGTNMRPIPIGEVQRGDYVVSGGLRPNRVKEDPKDSVADVLITFILSNGLAGTCTPSERFITSRADKQGTRIDQLTFGDELLCWRDGRIEKATIEELRFIRQKEIVRTLSLKPGKTFLVLSDKTSEFLGVLAHNNKLPVDIEGPPQN